MAIFAKYDGIDGESRDSLHQEWIDVLSVDWGMRQPATTTAIFRRRRGSVTVEDFKLVMEYDKASPKLQEKCLRGEVIPKLEIEQTATFGGMRQVYLKYELRNVMVVSVDINATGNDEAGPPTVVVTNNFEEVKVTYTQFGDSGQSSGNIEYEWDVLR